MSLSAPGPDRTSLDDLFHHARTIESPELRAEFLDQACAGDAELRERVENLLSADARAGGFLETRESPAESASPARLVERPGQMIGQFKLLQLIGEGGFGSVFLAEQDKPISRRVALKIIKPGMDSRLVAARFEAERQALALMDHPHIARVFDGGITDAALGSRPYFVMEYVVGDPITRFADRHRLSIEERLVLFGQVCEAVQHAHTKGIIHRDLKPGNVLVSMVDGRPFAKVIDFGIAKSLASRLTEKTLFTEHRQLIGTPEYMSPEQAEGSPDIDTRTDVYALGVLLYELLAGSTPFDAERLRSAAFAEMQRIIREEDPPAPSIRLSRGLETLATTAAARRAEPARLSTRIRGELDWIVMKALDKDRARRYESPHEMADDLRRHLAGEAVVAAPASVMYRARKFVRNNKGPVATAGVVSAAVLMGLSGTAWQWRRADAANGELYDKLRRAELAEAEIKYKSIAAADPWEPSSTLSDGAGAVAMLRGVVQTRERWLGQDDIATVRALWALATIEDPAGGSDGLREEAAQRLERAGRHPDGVLLRGFAHHAWRALYVHQDVPRAQRWLTRALRSVRPVLESEGVAAMGGTQSLLRAFHLDGDTISGPSDEEVIAWERDLAGLRDSQLLEIAAITLTMSDRLGARPGLDDELRSRCERIRTLAGRLTEESPDDPHASTALACVLRALDVPADALRSAERSIGARERLRLAPSPFNEAVIGMSLHALGRPAEARAALSRLRQMVTADSPTSASLCLSNAESLIDPTPTPEMRAAEEGNSRREAEYRENIAIASAAIAAGDIATARDRLWATEAGRRGWEWRYLAACSETSMRVFGEGVDPVYCAALSPDGSRLATGYRGARPGACIWDTDTGALVATLPAAGGSNDVAFSPDGTRLLVCGFGTAVLWSLADQEAIVALPVAAGTSPAGAFSPDGEHVLTWTWGAPPQVWSAITGELVATIPLEMDGDRAREGLGDAAFMADGGQVITAHFDHAMIWDAAGGGPVRTLGCANEQAREVRVSPDGRSILGFGFSSEVVVWDAETGEIRTTLALRGTRGAANAAFSHDGALIVTAGYGRGVRVWDAATGVLLHDLSIDRVDGAHTATFSPDGRHLLVWGGGRAAVHEVSTGDRVLGLSGHTGEVWDARFSPDSSRIVTGSLDGTARLWSTERPTNPLVLYETELEPVTSLQFAPDGKSVLASNSDQWRLWDLTTGQPGAGSGTSSGGWFRGYHHRYATLLASGEVLSWIDAAEILEPIGGTPVRTIVPASERVFNEGLGDIPADPVRVANASRDRILTATVHGSVRVADSRTGSTVLALQLPGCKGAELSPDGTRALAVLFEEATIRVFDALTGETLFDLAGQLAKFDPTGTHIFTLSASGLGARIWDARTGQLVSVLDLPPDQLDRRTNWPIWWSTVALGDACVFSPDGSRMIVPFDDWSSDSFNCPRGAGIYDVRTGRRVAALQAEFGSHFRFAFSPDGARIASCRFVDPDGGNAAGDVVIGLWDAESGSQVLRLPFPSLDGFGVCSLAWSPDGRRLAAGGYDGQIAVFEAAAGEPGMLSR